MRSKLPRPPASPPPPDEEDNGVRPTPVRSVMKTDPPPTAPPAPPVERTIEMDGRAWRVRPVGWTRSGTGSDRGAPLILVAFSHAEAPDDPIREAMAVARTLDELSDPALEELFERSRPYRGRTSGGG